MNGFVRRLLAAALGLPLAMSALTGPGWAGTTDRGHDRSCREWIGLTFDDGPSHYRTATLRTLRRNRVPATFFDVGMRVAANPQFAAFEAREGHLVLNHTWSHPHLPALEPAQVRSQVLRTQQVLRKAGAPMPFKLLRPPFGDIDDAVRAQLTRLGYHYVNWDVVAVDWDVATTSDEIRDTIVNALRPGLVILMHDGPIDSAAGAAVQAALPQVIHRAKRAGYCFGLLNARGEVVPATLRPAQAAVPRVINPVPYLPLGATSGGLLPPRPYVIVDPAAEL
ncbi:polysaccharide deacetylase family protein [Actinoplanes sp. NPDC051633]|uniref:polysaccharide deacetylase family protein n=1 Tax=Actinoplanes sp. NPDC051633 TaxID=3155670 RepID=UPI0034306C1B